MFAFLAPYRLYLIAGTAVLAGGALGGGYLYVKNLQARVDREHAAAVAAQQGAALAEATTETVVRYHTTERVIRETAEPIIQTIQEAADAETPVPPDVLAAWRSGVGRLREPAAPAAGDFRSAPTQ